MFSFYSFKRKLWSESVSSWCTPAMKNFPFINYQINELDDMLLFITQLCLTLPPRGCSTPGFWVLPQLPELTQTHDHWVSDAIQPSCPLSSPLLLPSIFPSIRVFSNESALRIRWPKYWSFSISSSHEYSALISFRMDWLISLLSKGLSRVFANTTVLKASILWH